MGKIKKAADKTATPDRTQATQNKKQQIIRKRQGFDWKKKARSWKKRFEGIVNKIKKLNEEENSNEE